MRFKSCNKNKLKTTMAKVAIAAVMAVLPMNTLITAATMMAKAPTNSHLPIWLRSRLMTMDRLDMTKKMKAVPPKAVMIRSEPFLKPKTMANMRESIRPMKNVKASSTGTPAALFLVFSMAYMKPNAPPKNTIRPMKPVRPAVMPVSTPTQAPRTVGIMDRASRR